MKKFIIIIVLFYISGQDLLSQTYPANKNYKLKSLEGTDKEVYIKFDYVNNNMSIQLNTSEKICLEGFRGLVEDIKIISQEFIELNYVVFGGSSVFVRNRVLICISNDTLCEAINMTSAVYSYLPVDDSLDPYDVSSTYEIKDICIKQNDNNNFFLTATEQYSTHSKSGSVNDINTQDSVYLNFDPNYNIFFNKYEVLFGEYTLIDGISGHNFGNIRFNGEVIRTICLKEGGRYYFIDGKWYAYSGRYNSFRKCTNPCK